MFAYLATKSVLAAIGFASLKFFAAVRAFGRNEIVRVVPRRVLTKGQVVEFKMTFVDVFDFRLRKKTEQFFDTARISGVSSSRCSCT